MNGVQSALFLHSIAEDIPLTIQGLDEDEVKGNATTTRLLPR